MASKLWSENKKIALGKLKEKTTLKLYFSSNLEVSVSSLYRRKGFGAKNQFHRYFQTTDQSESWTFSVTPFRIRFYFSKGGKWPWWHLEILSLDVLEENIRICFFNQDFVILQISNRTKTVNRKKSVSRASQAYQYCYQRLLQSFLKGERKSAL